MNADQSTSRRRWLPIAGLCVLCAILGAVAVSIVTALRPKGEQEAVGGRSEPTAFAYLEVRLPTHRFPEQDDHSAALDVFKDTQETILQSPRVLSAAIKRPEVAGLRSVQGREDPVEWLQDQLQVTFLGDSEIIEVSLTGNDPQEVIALVNAVVDTYVTGIVETGRTARKHRLTELERFQTEAEKKLEDTRNQFLRVAGDMGTADPEASARKRLRRQRASFQKWADLQRQLAWVASVLRRIEGELETNQMLLNQLAERRISQPELNTFSRSDPLAIQLTEELRQLRFQLAGVEDRNADTANELKRGLKAVEEKLAARQEELRSKWREQKRTEIEEEMVRLRAQVEVREEQKREFESEMNQAKHGAHELSESTIEFMMMRDDIGSLKHVLANIAEERERIELRSSPRISLLQRATTSRRPPSGDR